MSAHTPGPWSVTTFPGSEPQMVIVASAQMVANTLHRNDEANARLIAAAPELLRAAQDALSDFRFIERVDATANFKASILLLENAIVRATGAP